MADVDIEYLRTWIGTTQTAKDIITPRLAASLNAIFDVDETPSDGDMAPVGIHWCLAPDIAPMKGLGPDGHPARGGFLPPVPFPRRMWAGGALNFSGGFHVGDEVTRHSTIDDVVMKTGHSGKMIFVTVRHQYSTPRGEVLDERQDIVYREPESGKSTATVARLPPPQMDHIRMVKADPVLLFRYSAITFNGHRIHYDQPYVTKEEGYPGLIFHGPLQATCLLRLATELEGGRVPARFEFRSVNPLFAGGEIMLGALKAEAGLSLLVFDQNGRVTMKATC